MTANDHCQDEVERKRLKRAKATTRALASETRADYYRKRMILHSMEYFVLTEPKNDEIYAA
jgi:hypothetical protein